MEQHREECNGTRQKKIYKTLFCNAKDLVNRISVNPPVIPATPLSVGTAGFNPGGSGGYSPAIVDIGSRGFE
jgi:hypothetical protein